MSGESYNKISPAMPFGRIDLNAFALRTCGAVFGGTFAATINNTNSPALRLTPARSEWIRALYREFGSI
ncbi:unnamed protein product [Leptosia nina]|uniref:LAGLIDADG homing endonuclease n=1 Tax=Leptosia nina TaxID=320188 RepID=A0AAV1J3Z5_9NEOP